MIKNWLLAGCLAALVGCARHDATPPGYQGIVELDERVLAFEVQGRISEVAVRRGDVVADGQVLAKLDDALEKITRQARADDANAAQADLALLLAGSRAEDVASLAADVRAALAAEEVAQKNYERMAALHKLETVPQAELDRATADRDRAVAQRKSLEQRLAALRHGARPEEIARAQARVEAAKSALELEDARLARYELRATSGGGMVLDVHVEPGEMAVQGTPVATLADVAHPYVDVFVPQGSLTGIKVGTRGAIRTDSSKDAAHGIIEYISPKTEFTPRFLFSERERPHLVIRVRVRVTDGSDRLHAGIPAFVAFE
jgi:HlyD family secretion protein